MELHDALHFLETNHMAVISTQKPNGAMHSSVVVCGAYKENAAFVTVYPRSQKIKNLRRNSNCTVLTMSLSVTNNSHSYVVIEGKATLFDYGNTDPDSMKDMLREAYMACSGVPHPNWEEYDEAMIRQEAVIVLVRPDRAYGLLGNTD